MTQREAADLVAILAELYDQPAWTTGRLRIFADAIADLDAAAASRAVDTWMKTRRERPQPADIRKLVAEAGTELPEPEEAYGLVHARFATRGPTDLPEAIMEAVRLTGRTWDDLAYMQFDDYPWFRRDFLSAYREVRSRVLSDTQSRQGALPDRAEARALLDAIAKGSA